MTSSNHDPGPQTGGAIERRDAVALVADRYGFESEATPLPSYADANFRIEAADGRRFILRIAQRDQNPEPLEFQNAVLERLAESGLPAPLVVPVVVPDRNGDGLASVAFGHGARRIVRLHTWIDGEMLANVASPAPDLFAELGRLLGRIDVALGGFATRSPDNPCAWDLTRAAEARVHLSSVAVGNARDRAARVLDRFEALTMPKMGDLPSGVIHNDANQHNVLVGSVTPPISIAGITDFGDAMHSPLVSEPSIAAAYAMLDRPDPIAVARELVRGYVECVRLSRYELELIPELIETRLVVSVVHSAGERARQPDNEYISVNEVSAWRLLRWFEGDAREELRRALVALAAPESGRPRGGRTPE